MFLEEIVLDGFKSYATRTVVSSWDREFNAITGLNGTGKSNVLDGICFVLGIDSSRRMRVESLQDLIYKRGQAGITKAVVTLILNNENKRKAPVGFKQQDKLIVARQIAVGGKGKYLINGHTAQASNVRGLFQSVHLNVNNPTFLIMQGQITKILNMKPVEIGEMIEECAGTRIWGEKKDKAGLVIGKKEKKVDEIGCVLKEVVEPRLKKLQKERNDFVVYQKFLREYEQTKAELAYKQCLEITETKKRLEHKIAEDQQRSKAIFLELELLNAKIKKQQEQVLHEKEKKAETEILEKKFEEIGGAISKKKFCFETLTNDTEKEKKTFSETKQEKERLVSDYEKKVSWFDKQHSLVQELEQKEISLYEEKKEADKLLASIRGNKKDVLKILDEQTSRIASEIVKEKKKTDELETEICRIEAKANEAYLTQKNTEERKKKLEEQIEKLSASQNQSLVETETKLLLERERLKTEYQQLSKETEEAKRHTQRAHFGIEGKGIYGTVASLLTLDKRAAGKENALETIAGGRLFHVVVDNEQTAKKLLQENTLKQRVTFLPLNKMIPKTISQTSLHAAKEAGALEACSLINYANDVSGAVQFVFGGSFVCMNKETAKKVAFDKKISSRAVTVDGDVYEPSGTLTGGSSVRRVSVLEQMANIKKIEAQIKEYEEALKKIEKTLQDVTVKKRRDEKTEIEISRLRSEHCNLREQNTELVYKESQRQLSRMKRDHKIATERVSELVEKEKKRKKELIPNKENHDPKIGGQIEERYKNIVEEEKKLAKKITIEKAELQKVEFLLQEFENEIAKAEELEKKAKKQNSDKDTELDKLKREIQEMQAEEREVGLVLQKQRETQPMSYALKQKEKEIKDMQNKVSALKQNTLELEEEEEINRKKTAELQEKEEKQKKCMKEFNVSEHIGKKTVNELKKKLLDLEERKKLKMKKINTKVFEMTTRMEEKEKSLSGMLSTVKKDKRKIETTIEKLADHKKNALEKAWASISKSFGEIFSVLLPGCTSCLCQNNNQQEAQIKVCLGGVWKESLSELSGGQRSLVALSLILAMLKYHPSPIYILDEIDAALDLQHTQNIGTLLKSHFQNSQFIVVSLKDGMFTNANTIFQTSLKDGVSAIQIIKTISR